jgi:hypothetical protein
MSGDKRCNMTVDSKFLKVSHITIMYKRVSKQLLNLNHSKATGFDGLKYRLLKEFIKGQFEMIDFALHTQAMI